jgi:hypothetical protein
LSAAHGQLHVDFDPDNGNVSVGSHGLRITDPGVLSRLANNYRKSGEAGQLIISGEKGYTVAAIQAPFHVTIGGIQQQITEVKISVASELNLDHSVIPSGDLKVTAEIEVESPQGQKTSIDYTIATSFQIEPPKKRPRARLTAQDAHAVLLEVLGGASLVVIGSAYVVTKLRSPQAP